MKVLKYNQFYLTLLGISSNRLTEATNEFWKSLSSYVMLIGLVIVMFMGTLIYVFQNMYHLTLALRAILLICASLQCAGSYTSIGLKMKKVKRLQLQIQEFVDNGNLINCE